MDHPQGATVPTKRRGSLTRASIIEAARDLAESEGIDALTMRRLGEKLGVAPMAIYRHFGNKDDLVDAVVDDAAQQLIVPPMTGDWKARLRDLMGELHRQLVAAPEFIALRMRRPMLSPGALRFTDEAMGALRGAGFSSLDAARAYRVLFIYTFGAAAFGPSVRSSPDESAARSALASLPPDDFPAIAGNLTELASTMNDHELFAFGLDKLLAGLQAQLSER
jgi:AcrR family transcriptional regulator